jgi:hypothetical protein
MDFETFADSMKKQGFDQVVKRVWEPRATVEEHTHPFDAKALVVEGEMWLTVNGHALSICFPAAPSRCLRTCRTPSATAPIAPPTGWRAATSLARLAEIRGPFTRGWKRDEDPLLGLAERH